jgi:hypothetical protein
MFSLGTFQRIFVTKLKKKRKKKGCFAPLCVPLGLKKPGDFTGHRHPLVLLTRRPENCPTQVWTRDSRIPVPSFWQNKKTKKKYKEVSLEAVGSTPPPLSSLFWLPTSLLLPAAVPVLTTEQFVWPPMYLF